jgi:uncharacterized membrane protein YcaP (DUF421 family)
MPDALTLHSSLMEIALRGTAVYLAIAAIMRFIPKRQTGNVSPNDFIALVIVGSLAADAILADASNPLDILLMVAVVLIWDYLFNVLEYRFPWFRRVAQDSPTLLIHNGRVLERNLRQEQLTIEELKASLRKKGIDDLEQVKQAILEVDGEISVIQKTEAK